MSEKKSFLIGVELKFISEAIGHGLFATENVLKGTPAWIPSLVEKIPCHELTEKLSVMTPLDAHEYLRQGFVLASDLDHLCVNTNDLGRFTNHSSNPNMGFAEFSASTDASVALRDIAVGEEITCNYNGLGSPQWYKDLCIKYGVISTDEVAKL